MDAQDANVVGQVGFNEAEQCGGVEVAEAECPQPGQSFEESLREKIGLGLVAKAEEERRQVQVGQFIELAQQSQVVHAFCLLPEGAANCQSAQGMATLGQQQFQRAQRQPAIGQLKFL